MFGRSKQKDSSEDDYLLEQFALEDEIQEIGWFRSFFSFIGETIKVLVLAAAIILPIRYFLIQPFYVKGASMEPNFKDSEYLMINEITYRFAGPERGDITVFRYPRDLSQFFIKRVIGMPNERVEIRNNEVFVYDAAGNEIELFESVYLPEGTKTTVHGGQDSYELGQNEYFLLGDNREHSLDSRNFGPVDENHIVGKVWFRGWPLDRIQVFE